MIKKSKYSDKILHADVCEMGESSDAPKFDCVTALFDVINYVPTLHWIKNLPLKKGGYFIFDIWNMNKVNRDGFRSTFKRAGEIRRTINPHRVGDRVDLDIFIRTPKKTFDEKHILYLYSKDDIIDALKGVFEIVVIKHTDTWQSFYKAIKL